MQFRSLCSKSIMKPNWLSLFHQQMINKIKKVNKRYQISLLKI